MTIPEALEELNHPSSPRFSRLLTICETIFGAPRIAGSHHVFKTPWAGDPRINLQPSKGDAKPYQVRQVIRALERLQSIQTESSEDTKNDDDQNE